jgi:hypothetical protein
VAGRGALPKQSGCNAHDKTCSSDFQDVKNQPRLFCFFFGQCKKDKKKTNNTQQIKENLE